MEFEPISGMRAWMRRVDRTLQEFRRHRHPTINAQIDELNTQVSEIEAALPGPFYAARVSGVTSSGTVTFPPGRFSSPPVVSVTIVNLSTNRYMIKINNVTANGFSVQISLDGGGTIFGTFQLDVIAMTATD